MESIPEYFYNQSGVIPYRVKKGKLEILLITSRKTKRWIIPKGIIEPELSAEESAKREAFEEAGIEGELFPGIVGKYEHQKWEGICIIQILILKVNKIFDNWPEDSFRKRKWFDLNEGVKLIENQDLKLIIKNLPTYLKELPNHKGFNA